MSLAVKPDRDGMDPGALSAEWEVLTLIGRQVGTVPWPVFLSMMLIASLAWGRMAEPVVLTWGLLVCAVLLLRWRLLRAPSMDRAMGPQLHLATWLSGINGLTHALSTLAFPVLPEVERAIVSLLLAGLSAGSVATTAGHPRVFPAYVIPAMGSVAVAWTLVPTSSERSWAGISMGLLALMYMLVLLGLGRDNHRRLLASTELRQREAALNQDLVKALAQAEAANAAKTRFLAAASHDLRQPLHTLSLFSAALQAQDLTPQSQEILVYMNRAIGALGEQLSALLDLSKLDAEVVQATLTGVPVYALLSQLHEQYQEAASHKGLKLVLEADESLCVHSDGLHLSRVVRNLVDNAVKYSDGGTIWLQASPLEETGKVQIQVRDTGRGIAIDQQTRVFEEFFQLENPERDRNKGLGLGLSIVRRLCQLLEIDLAMQSEPGVGTRFTLTLPEGDMPTQVSPTAAPVDTSVFKGLKVLVIDDEADVRAAMLHLLGSMGATVWLAASTFESLGICNQERPDIVLADFRLRGEESGIRAIRKIRQIHPEMPALLISGDTAPDRLQEAQQEGLILLHKPVSADLLIQAVTLVLAPGEGE